MVRQQVRVCNLCHDVQTTAMRAALCTAAFKSPCRLSPWLKSEPARRAPDSSGDSKPSAQDSVPSTSDEPLNKGLDSARSGGGLVSRGLDAGNGSGQPFKRGGAGGQSMSMAELPEAQAQLLRRLLQQAELLLEQPAQQQRPQAPAVSHAESFRQPGALRRTASDADGLAP